MSEIITTPTIKYSPDKVLTSNPCKKSIGKKIIVIGSSTGGVEALAYIIPKLPVGLPPIVIVQHIPANFSSSFASRLNLISEVTVMEISDKEVLKPSHAYIAHGARHLVIECKGNEYVGRSIDGEKVNRHKPSVDVLFRSANNVAGRDTMAIILTGMGDDGSLGMKELFDNGAQTIAQSEETCVVFGMPKQAIARGAVKEVLDLDKIPDRIIKFGKLYA